MTADLQPTSPDTGVRLGEPSAAALEAALRERDAAEQMHRQRLLPDPDLGYGHLTKHEVRLLLRAAYAIDAVGASVEREPAPSAHTETRDSLLRSHLYAAEEAIDRASHAEDDAAELAAALVHIVAARALFVRPSVSTGDT